MQNVQSSFLLRTLSVCAVASASFVACAHHTKAPHAEVADVHAAISAAETAKPSHAPQVDLHLQLARENTERAQKLIEAGKNDEARFVLMRAQSDAELAMVMAKEAIAEQQAQAALEKVRTLRSQIGE